MIFQDCVIMITDFLKEHECVIMSAGLPSVPQRIHNNSFLTTVSVYDDYNCRMFDVDF